MDEKIKNLIRQMKDEVDKASAEGELDRHCCQYICEDYIKKTASLFRENKNG